MVDDAPVLQLRRLTAIRDGEGSRQNCSTDETHVDVGEDLEAVATVHHDHVIPTVTLAFKSSRAIPRFPYKNRVVGALFDSLLAADKRLVESHQELEILQRQRDDLQQQCARLADELALARQREFGASSEKLQSEAEVPADVVVDASTASGGDQKPASKVRLASSNAGRKPLPASLRREDVRYELAESERACDRCHDQMIEVGQDVTEKLVSVPAHAYVRRQVRSKYVCRACNCFKVAPSPAALIPGSSFDSPEFLSRVAVDKYQFGLPLNRQVQIFESQSVPVNSTTLSNLMIAIGQKLAPVAQLMREALLRQGAIHADETVIQVLKEPGREPESQSYLWVLRSNAVAAEQVVFCEYRPTRSGAHARELLTLDDGTAFTGVLQVDGYAGYDQFEQSATVVACMAHIRRKFHEALAILTPEQRAAASATEVMELIGQLYEVEARAKGHPADAVLRLRREEARPIFDRIKAWLDTHGPTVLPKSPLGRAVRYALEQWGRMEHYLEHPQSAIDNNIIEREIRRIVMGRKAWLFADTQAGARANAVLYSLVLSALANGIDPYRYFVAALTRLPSAKTAEDYLALLPWSIKEVLLEEPSDASGAKAMPLQQAA